MTAQLKNNALGYLAADISASDTGLALGTGEGSAFPTLTGTQYFYATLVSAAGTLEVVKVTARVGDALTVVRAQEGTIANGFATGARVELRVTAASIIDSITDRTSISVKDFGAVGDGVTDDTAAIQAAIDAAAVVDSSGDFKASGAVKGRVYIPAGDYRASQLNFRNGIHVEGEALGHFGASGQASISMLRQLPNINDDFIVFTDYNLSGEIQKNAGPIKITNLNIRGDNTNTSGSGIVFRDPVSGDDLRVQDFTFLENVNIRGFAEYGIDALAGCGPLFLSKINLRQNGLYGARFRGRESGGFMSFTHLNLSDISCDGNKNGAIFLQDINDQSIGYRMIVTINIKSEASEIPDNILNSSISVPREDIITQNDLPQRFAVVFEDCDCAVNVVGLEHIANNSGVTGGASNYFAPRAAFKILTGTGATNLTPDINWGALQVRKLTSQSGSTFLIEDDLNSVDIPWDEQHHGSYSKLGRHYALGAVRSEHIIALSDNYVVHGRDSAVQVSGTTPACVWYKTDGATDEKAWNFGVYGDNLELRTISDDGITTTQVEQYERNGNDVKFIKSYKPRVEVQNTLPANTSTPSILAGNTFISANTVATSISNFSSGQDGHYFDLLVNDANTTILNNANIALKSGGNEGPATSQNKLYRFKRISGKFYET